MLLTVTIAAIILANAEAFTHRDANKYMDYVLTSRFLTEADYSRIDPYKFPDIKVDLISKRITDNKATLTKGRLTNLSSVKRYGDCSAPHWSSANISFTCALQFRPLVLNYTANVTYDNMQLVFYPTTSISETTVTIQISTTRDENIPDLRLLVVNNIGKMYVTAKMISIGDISHMIGPSIREAIVQSATVNLHKTLNGAFKSALGYSIYKTPVPFV